MSSLSSAHRPSPLLCALVVGFAWLLAPAGSALAEEAEAPKATWRPEKPKPGDLVLVELPAGDPVTQVKLGKSSCRVIPHGKGWIAFGSVKRLEKGRRLRLEVKRQPPKKAGAKRRPRATRERQWVPLEKHKPAGETIEKGGHLYKTPEWAKKRVKKQDEQMRDAFALSAEELNFEGPFALPDDDQVRGPYGNWLVVKKKVAGARLGVDVTAAAGDSVTAVGRGQVLATMEHVQLGKLVVLDHGAGLLTVYAHLSELSVERGALVERGAEIGKAGKSGRVPEPMLHLRARVGSRWVNPMSLKVLGTLGEG